MIPINDVYRRSFDWARFWVRFTCGALLGSLLGFGFWVQMCRPANSLGLGEWPPRQVAEWLGLEARIDSGITGLVVVLVVASAAGTIVGLWRSQPR
jgi:hypothetical protein